MLSVISRCRISSSSEPLLGEYQPHVFTLACKGCHLRTASPGPFTSTLEVDFISRSAFSQPLAMSNPQPEEAYAAASSLPPQAIELATRLYNAARQGDAELLQPAIAAGLPPNMTNEKGDTLVSISSASRGCRSYKALGYSLIVTWKVND